MSNINTKMRYLKTYKIFESVDNLAIEDIISSISDNILTSFNINSDSVIVGIGDEDKIYNPNGSSPEDLIDISEYESDLIHLNSYLEESGFKIKNVAIWEKSSMHSYSDKLMNYDFTSFVNYIKKNRIIYCDIMWQKV
jgi:hypothetical protein